MNDLKMVTKVTHFVDYNDLERFLSEKLGKNVEVIGSSNDTDYSTTVRKLDPESPMYKWDMEEVEQFKQDGIINCEYGGFHQPLAYAATEGWIAEGEYVIRVSW